MTYYTEIPQKTIWNQNDPEKKSSSSENDCYEGHSESTSLWI